MLTNQLFELEIDIDIIREIFFDFHTDGPINQSHLETLSFLKRYNPEKFKEFEPKLMYLMGLFYKSTGPMNFVDAIYQAYSDTIIEQTGHNFTPVQADAYNSIKQSTNFSFSAPTSAGKSFLFQELIKEIKGDIIIILPSRALISEYLIKIKNLVSKETLVLEFIEVVNIRKTKNRIFIITPERGEEIFKNIDKLNLELILLDEAQITEEGIRGMKFDSLVRRIDKNLKTVKKVFTHPFILNPEAQFSKHNITENIDSESYKQNTVGKLYIEHKNGTFKYFSPFKDLIGGQNLEANIVKETILNGGTALIYISKTKIYDSSFIDSFAEYIEICPELKDEESLFYINKLEDFFGTKNNEDKFSILIFLMKRGVVIHHGSIPLSARLIIEEFVNKRHAKVCFSTSTLIQGINMPFDIVWVNHFSFTGKSEDQKVLNLKNLIGRAGRVTETKNQFDYGIVIIEKTNKNLFIKRLNLDSSLSDTSSLDDETDPNNEDFIDIVDAIKNDTFNSELQLTESQIDRISNANLDDDISFILDNFLNDENQPLSVKQYYELSDYKRKKIKVSFQKIYKAHMRRQFLEKGEESVLSTSIPILLWLIQGKSFAEIVNLRHAFLSEKDFRRRLRKQLVQNEISIEEFRKNLEEKKPRFSCIAESLPNKSFKRPVPLFRFENIVDLSFDKIIYDTYDYIDKVLSLSVKDPVSSTLILYFNKTNDKRALILSNLIKYGTNDETEIWLLKYGFSFEQIEIIKDYIEDIDEYEIKFKGSINEFIKDPEKLKLIERYI